MDMLHEQFLTQNTIDHLSNGDHHIDRADFFIVDGVVVARWHI